MSSVYMRNILPGSGCPMRWPVHPRGLSGDDGLLLGILVCAAQSEIVSRALGILEDVSVSCHGCG